MLLARVTHSTDPKSALDLERALPELFQSVRDKAQERNQQISGDALFTFALTGIAGALMASNRVRFDLIALLVVVALILSGILTVGEALSGFGSSVVIMVAALLVVGEMLDRTGVAKAIGAKILELGGSNQTRLLVLLMVAAAFLGSLMSSTAVVAIFIPIVIKISVSSGIAGRKLLLPMSYAALISGMLTLIATPPNLVVSDALADHGFEPLGFFSFFPIGLVILAFAVAYFILFGRFLLKDSATYPVAATNQRASSIWATAQNYGVEDHAHILSVTQSLTSQEVALALGSELRVLGRKRPGSRFDSAPVVFSDGMEVQIGDELLVFGSQAGIEQATQYTGLSSVQSLPASAGDWITTVGAADIMVHPEASETGGNLKHEDIEATYDVKILGVQRKYGETADSEPGALFAGDRILVSGRWEDIDMMLDHTHDFVLISMPKERQDHVPAYSKFALSLGILAFMVVLSATQIVPVIVAVLLAAILAVAFKTLSAEQAYDSIHWSSIVLVAGMLPLADALEVTGATQLIVESLFQALGDASPRVMMATLFALTAGLGLVLSNTASAVLVVPIAIVAAETMGVSPYPMAISVLIAASAAFSTPVSTPIVTLVVAPGGYSFIDFLRAGLPLTFAVGIVTVLVTPLVFPF